jgi:GTP diphosphokinase / guanosine-3',5'-bis(diphosphate) 3'-diphosphatase
MNGLQTVSQAACFAAERHSGQTRKGARGLPYINHLAEVAALVAMQTDGEDANLVAAAWLHDTVEDTDTSRTEIAARFGEDVAALVMEATDDKSLPKQERKRLQEVTAAHKSARAKILKIADKLSNVREILADPPHDWDLQRRHDYVAWAARVVSGLRGHAPQLEAEFDRAAELALAAFQP